MDANAWVALIGATAVAAVVRLSNIVIAWLARILGVDPPDPIPTPTDDDS